MKPQKILTLLLGPAAALSLWAGNPFHFKPIDVGLKPVTIPTVPSPSTVHEVGGVQYGRHVDIKLDDGLTVRCFPAATDNPKIVSKNYYYLPANPHVSIGPDGLPRFSMIRFVSDKTKEQGGAEGAILDIMVEYGLSKKQFDELRNKLRRRVPGAVLKGAVPLEVGSEGNSFYVTSAVLGDKGFTSTLLTSGKAPVMEGQKVAIAARLDPYGATLLGKSLEQSTTDISVNFDLKYVVKIPAYDVRIVIDYDKYHKIRDKIIHQRQEFSRHSYYWNPKWYSIFHIGTQKHTYVNEKERHTMVDFLKENGIVQFIYIQHIPDEDKEIVESGLYGKVIDIFFEMQKRLGNPNPEEMTEENSEDQNKKDKERRQEAAKHDRFSYSYLKAKRIERHGKVELSLKKIGARYEYYTMTGNIGGWYKKYKNNKKLVREVNLDDPFFSHRELRFVIDNEAYDIFKNVINYATVQVKVDRKGQPPFIDEVTIDKNYLQQHGQTATITYAPMRDESRTFQYKVQWSLRGGHLYPADARWNMGAVMAVTLSAPVHPVLVEAEADLDELKSMNVARVSVELRYRQFGKPYIDHSSLAISTASGNPMTSKTIYPDVGSDKLEYRLVYHHKKLGRIKEKKWRSVEGNYIFCSPEESIVAKLTGG